MPGFFLPKNFLISAEISESGFFLPGNSSDDGTAHSSVGELRQEKQYLYRRFLRLFCFIFIKNSVNNKIIAFAFSIAKTENPLKPSDKSLVSPPYGRGSAVFFGVCLGFSARKKLYGNII